MTMLDGRHECGAPVTHHAFLSGMCFRCERLLEEPPEVVWFRYACPSGHIAWSTSPTRLLGRACGSVPRRDTQPADPVLGPFYGVSGCANALQLT